MIAVKKMPKETFTMGLKTGSYRGFMAVGGRFANDEIARYRSVRGGSITSNKHKLLDSLPTND